MIENVLLGSPLICSLKLVNGYGFSKLVIASKSLKVLHLEYVKCDLIELSCPNLEKFILCNFSGGFFLSLKLPYSLRASLDILPWNRETRQWDRRDFVKQLIRQFQNVKDLTVKPSLFKILSKFDVETRRSLPLLHCKWLTLDIDTPIDFALPGIAYVFHSPLLETLVLNLKFMVYQSNQSNLQHNVDKDTTDYWNSDWCTGFTCLVSQYLMTVKIVGVREKEDKCNHVLEFIEFLLKSARGLKKMTVELERPGTSFLVEFSQKLLSFPKYSRRASVEVLCSA